MVFGGLFGKKKKKKAKTKEEPVLAMDASFENPAEVPIRTMSGKWGTLMVEAVDGDGMVGMIDIAGELEIRNMNSYCEVSYAEQRRAVAKQPTRDSAKALLTISVVSNSADKWRAAVGFGAPIDDWRITKIHKKGHFYKQGVRRGYRIVAINGQKCVDANRVIIKKMLKKGQPCTIVFEEGTMEDLEKYRFVHE